MSPELKYWNSLSKEKQEELLRKYPYNSISQIYALELAEAFGEKWIKQSFI